MKNISLNFIRATEAGAIAASKLIGSGDKFQIDKVATEAMRKRLNEIEFSGKIVISEYEKDESYGLLNGELVGKKYIPDYYEEHYTINPLLTSLDICVDVVDGTTMVAEHGPEAISALAISNKDTMYKPKGHYVKKFACGPNLASYMKGLSFYSGPEAIVKIAKRLLHRPPTVCLLNRPRHEEYIAKFRELGCQLKLIPHCDISAVISTCIPDSGVDIYFSDGGAPECVISAAAVKCLKGYLHCIDDGKYLTQDNLIQGNCVFVATGITDGSFLRGVKHTPSGIRTNSVFMRSTSGTVRWLDVFHGN